MVYLSWHERDEVKMIKILSIYRFMSVESGSCQVSLLYEKKNWLL